MAPTSECGGQGTRGPPCWGHDPRVCLVPAAEAAPALGLFSPGWVGLVGCGLRGRDPFCSSNKICLVKRCVVCSWHGHFPSPSPSPSLCPPPRLSSAFHILPQPPPRCTPLPASRSLPVAPGLFPACPCLARPPPCHPPMVAFQLLRCISLSLSFSPLPGQLGPSASPWLWWLPCRTWWSGRGSWHSLSAW